MMIKRVQTEEHEMKVLSVSDDNTIFLLRDINCHTRIQSMLKSFKKASSSEINFSKFQPYGLRHIKIGLISQGKWYGPSFSLKYLKCIL